MTGPVGDDVAGEVEPAQGEVADEVEYLVPGRFVGEAQAVADRPAVAEHDQVRGRQVPANALRTQRVRLGRGHERAAPGHLAHERAGVEVERERLSVDRANGTV